MNRKQRVKRIERLGVYLIGAFILLLCVIMIMNLSTNPTITTIIRDGVVSKSETRTGYIIRDEIVVSGENYENGMEQIADENSKVAKGKSIYRYYSNTEEDVKNKMKEIDEQVEKAMNENTETIFSSDTKLLDSLIEEKARKLNGLTSIQDIQEYKKEIDTFISKKARIVAELSPEDSALKQLISQREEYENLLTQDSEYVSAPISGIVSYRVDGLEEEMNASDLGKYNNEYLKKLDLNAGQIVPTSSEKGKVINNFECFIAFTSDTNEALNAKVGDKLTIELPSMKKINASIVQINDQDKDYRTIILRFDTGIEELSLYRKISFEVIWWNSKGYKIPETALVTDNNLSYVIKERDGNYYRVLVKVRKKAEGYAIISNYSKSELEKLNDDFKTNDAIANYDEIILNPTEEQVYKSKISKK